jgi:GNAT superfamily N-acetyltransferase
MLRKLDLRDMDAAALVRPIAFGHAFPWISHPHAPQQDQWFFRERLLKTSELWGASDDVEMIGIIAFRADWIDQLYVLPKAQGRGVGTELLQVAQRSYPRLQLWTFQRNARARRFYERRGFVFVRETDGTQNEEKEPDALYLWTRD